MRIVSGQVRRAIGFHAVAVIGVVRIRRALSAVFRNREAVARRVLRRPGQHSDRHDRVATCSGDVGDELRGIVVERIAGISKRAIREVPIGGGARIEVFPVVPRGRVAAPANQRRAAIGNVRGVRREIDAVNVRADRVAIAERVNGHLNRGADGICRSCADLRGIGALARGVESGDDVEIGCAICEARVGEARGCGRRNLRVRSATHCRTLQVIARRARRRVPGQAHLRVSRDCCEAGRHGRRGDGLRRGRAGFR